MTAGDTSPFLEQLEVHRIELDDQGYDGNGSYWGTGTPLFWVTTADGKHDCFVRADDATRARLIAAEEIPLLVWERDQAEIERNGPTVVEPEHLYDGRYGFAECAQIQSAPPPNDKRGTAIQQTDRPTELSDDATQAPPARPAGKAGGSGPAGQAGPT